ncbi:MAG: 5-(carboxyamino)imidazole ribonucleotide synthase [Thermomicrobiales bacterium]
MSYRRPTVGIVGAGQLARMMAQAAIPLDIRIVLLAADVADGAAQVVPDVIVGAPDDPQALNELAQRCDVITFDHELVPPELLADLERQGHRVWPSSSSMALAQNKRRQRLELSDAGFPVPPFANLDCFEDVADFGNRYGWPLVIKASQGGYDGRGVWIAPSRAEAQWIWDNAQQSGTVLLVEEYLPLELELAVLVARRPSGEMVVYPPVETVQRDGICRELRVPANVAATLGEDAVQFACEIAAMIGIVGIMAIEFFVSDGKLYVNELAPRPHTSGHWTIEGAVTSQFEQHLRAVLDLPLGDTKPTGHAIVTVNLLGDGEGHDPRNRLGDALKAGGHVHFYGKEARSGRKVGHVTAVADSIEYARVCAQQVVDSLSGHRIAQGDPERADR